MIDDKLKELYPSDNGHCTFHVQLHMNGDITHRSRGNTYCTTRVFCASAGMSNEETVIWLLKFGDLLPSSLDKNGELQFNELFKYWGY